MNLCVCSELNQQKEKASHHEVELQRRIEEVNNPLCRCCCCYIDLDSQQSARRCRHVNCSCGQVEKRGIAAAEGYHASLQALDAERNELRRDLHETQHNFAEVCV